MKNLLLLLILASVPALANGQAGDLQVSITASWDQSTLGPMVFNESFEENSSGVLLPGTLKYSISDPFGLGPFTLVSGAGAGNFYFANGDLIQVGPDDGILTFNLTKIGITHDEQNVVWLCPNGPCTNNDPYNGGYIASEYATFKVEPAETPEPPMWILLVAGAVLFGLLELVRRRS
jgi:hypothetical protein